MDAGGNKATACKRMRSFQFLLHANMNFQSRCKYTVLISAFVLALNALVAAQLLKSEKAYLGVNEPDGIALLAPPPVQDTQEDAADLNLVRSVVNKRTPEDKARAKTSASLSVFLFSEAIGPIFRPQNLPITEALLQKVNEEATAVINRPKDFWKRKRPYQIDGQLDDGEPVKGFSYPSGHSTRGTLYAMILAELFPEKKEAIAAVGRDIGWDRVVIAKHYFSDIRAGRVLGQAIARELTANPLFREDINRAKDEIKKAKDVQTLKPGISVNKEPVKSK